MSITSHTLLVLVALAALALPIALVLLRRRMRPSWPRTIASWLTIVLAQALAVTAVGLEVNRQFGFYASWDDALGQQDGGTTAITAGGIDASSAGGGSTKAFTIAGSHAGSAQAVVWLPPGYDDKANAHRRYPVVLPGYSNSVGATYENLQIGPTASQLVAAHKVQPFIVVVAPYQTVQGRDTECTNIKKGAQEYTYLTRSVPDAIRSHVRAMPGTANWSALGWSTGGYCAAKALYAQPSPWGSAVSMGGYFETLTDNTTGNLYPTEHDKLFNSPSFLYRVYQMPSTRLLIVASKQDKGSYDSSSKMAKIARNDSHVSTMWLPSGGHNYGTYVPHLDDMLTWALTPHPVA